MDVRDLRCRAALWAGLVLAIWIAAECEASFPPKFKDVTSERGLIPRRRTDMRVPLINKYWGCLIADFDRDEKYDMFLPNHGNNPDFYWGVGSRFQYQNISIFNVDLHSAAAMDLDGDGDLDFFHTRGGSNGDKPSVPFVMEVGNNRDKRAIDRSIGEKFGFGGIEIRGRSSAVLDIDCDGDLDVLFINREPKGASDFIHLLYENLGNGRFIPRKQIGLQNVPAYWFHLVDVNSDGALDILMMGFSPIQLWMGTCTRRFKKDTLGRIPNEHKLNHVRAAAEIDYNGDGQLDLYLARGSTRKDINDILLENRNGFFVDVSREAGIPTGGRHYHVMNFDANNDGRMDLYLSRMTWFKARRLRDLLLVNEGDRFEVAGVHGTESRIPYEDGDNANAFDFDDDGRIDIIGGYRNSTWRLYRNTTPYGARNYLSVLIGKPRAKWFDSALDRPAMGAEVRVICRYDAKKFEFVQRVGSQGQSHSQSYMERLHFGVGRCETVAQIIVKYVGGFKVTRTGPIRVNRSVTVGLYHQCPDGFDGQNCGKTISKCLARPCEDGAACEILERSTENCPRMWRCDPSSRKFGLSCEPKPCLRLNCPV